MCKKNTAYYVQSLKKFTGELEGIANLIGELGEDAAQPIIDFMKVYGFTFEKDECGSLRIHTPKVHSVWGIRAYSKKLITLQDLKNFLESKGELYDYSEEELWEIVDIIASGVDYPNHVHQSAENIGNAVAEFLSDSGEYDEEDDETEEEDDEPEQKSCEDCPYKPHPAKVFRVVIG